MRDEDLDEELRSHLEFQARKHVAAGMSPAEAWRHARLEFGGMDLTKEQCRDVRPWRRIEAIHRHLKYGVRCLVKSPAFSLPAIGILATGLGVTVAAFSAMNALLFRPLPLPQPRELTEIASVDRQGRLGRLPSTVTDTLENSRWLRGVCGFNESREGGEANGTLGSIGVLGFTGDCFRTLGIATELGRPILPADDHAGGERVAVITGGFWRRAYGGRRDVIGRRVRMPGATFTIVGVTEERFSRLMVGFATDLIVPLHQEPSQLPGGRRQDWWWVNVVGRRAAGISARQASAALAAQSGALLDQSLPRSFNAARRRQYLAAALTAAPAATGLDNFMRNRFGTPLLAIFGICLAILVIACVNLASLMLARTLRRRRELAVRLALGASRAHVAGMLALECVILVAAGAALSVPVALAVGRLIQARGAQMFDNFAMNLGFDSQTTLFFAIAVVAIVCALASASAWQARRLSRDGDWQPGGRRVLSGHGLPQKILIAAQMALTLALVAGSGLLGSSLRSLDRLDLGVRTEHVWDAMLASRPEGYNFAAGPYYRDLVRQAEAIPGVASAVLSDFIPFYNTMDPQPVAALDGGLRPELQAHVGAVTDGFFSLLGIRLEQGNDFPRQQSDGGAEPAAIVSQALAEQLGGAHALLGRQIRVGTSPAYQRLRVVGIASNAQLDLVDPSQTRPLAVYIDSWQHPEAQTGYPVLLLKTAGGPLPATALRRVVHGAGREYVARLQSLDAEKDGALVENRILAYLAGAFGILALGLAATGLFGLLSYQAASRTGEIGVRMALGARRAQIQWLIARQIGGLLAVGSAAGLGLALLEGKAIAGLLFGVAPADPELLAVSTLILAATAALGAWIPARRAALVDPLVALRHE